MSLITVHNSSTNLKDLGVFQEKPFYYSKIQKELEKTYPYLHLPWGTKQNNDLDKNSSFIYDIKEFNYIIQKYEELKEKDPEIKLGYILNRWYNHRTSTTVERLICSYNIARKEQNIKHKDIDLYLLNTPFDLKLSVMPEKFYKYKLEDFKKREIRNKLLEWLYMEQSKDGRFHLKNRLFIVCRGDNPDNKNLESKKLKSRFDLIDKKIQIYFSYLMQLKKQGISDDKIFNTIKIKHNGEIYQPKCEAIIVHN